MFTVFYCWCCFCLCFFSKQLFLFCLKKYIFESAYWDGFGAMLIDSTYLICCPSLIKKRILHFKCVERLLLFKARVFVSWINKQPPCTTQNCLTPCLKCIYFLSHLCTPFISWAVLSYFIFHPLSLRLTAPFPPMFCLSSSSTCKECKEWTQPMSLCFDWNSLLCCKLVSDTRLVCWNHRRERETDVEIWELGELETEQQKRRKGWVCAEVPLLSLHATLLCVPVRKAEGTERTWVGVRRTSCQLCSLCYTTDVSEFTGMVQMTDFTSKFTNTFQNTDWQALFDSKKCNFCRNWMSFVCFLLFFDVSYLTPSVDLWQHTHTHTRTLHSHSRTHSLTHSLTHAHARTHALTTHSHALTHARTHALTHAPTHTHTHHTHTHAHTHSPALTHSH